MPYIEAGMLAQAQAAEEILLAHGDIIRRALNDYADGNTKREKVLREQYEKVSGDPALSAERDEPGSLITTEGLRHLADTAKRNAEDASRAEDAILRFNIGDYE